MLEQPIYRLEDVAALRRLVDAHGWATLVTAGAGPEPVVSHLPVILDAGAGADELVVLSHLARKDAELHRLGRHPVALIVQGPHGYLSPTFYRAEPYVPTWNFIVAHLHGVPEVLGAEPTYDVLAATVDHFEAERDEPWRLDSVTEYARRIAPGTTGFRLRPARVVGKAKLSQDKPREVAERATAALETDRRHRQPALAAAMRAALEARR